MKQETWKLKCIELRQEMAKQSREHYKELSEKDRAIQWYKNHISEITKEHNELVKKYAYYQKFDKLFEQWHNQLNDPIARMMRSRDFLEE